MGDYGKTRRTWVISLAVLALGVGLVQAIDEMEAWSEFKARFNKKYTSPNEEADRRRVFLENKRYIESHGCSRARPETPDAPDSATISEESGLGKCGSSSFTQGINHLSDLTSDEINQSRNGLKVEEPVEEAPLTGLIEQLIVTLNETLWQGNMNESWYHHILAAPKLDWRSRGRVSKVKDQGNCGSCWSFATTGALESALAAQNRSILLSEQNLVDCSGRYGNHGCSGGLMNAAISYVRDNGIMASKDYPYSAKAGTCQFKRDKSVMRARGSVVLPRGNEALLRRVLSISGPLPVAIDASLRSFQFYKSGVYFDSNCKSSSRHLNHAVLLVGYGSEQGMDYWLVKNSWGTGWGDSGYIKMARGRSNHCGIASFAVLPLV